MSLIGDIGGVGAIADLLKDGMDKIWPDPAKRAEAELKIQELDNQLAQGQMAINQAEASSSNLFVAGARPFIMWVCGFGFAYHMIFQPLLTYSMAVFGHVFLIPQFDTSTLTTTMQLMLGLGAFRSYEKVSDKKQLPWQK